MLRNHVKPTVEFLNSAADANLKRKNPGLSVLFEVGRASYIAKN
jgi:hypothetical protein